MADNRRPQDKWRHAGGNGPAGAPAAPRGSSRASRLFLGGLLFAALAGVVIGLIFFLRPAPRPIFLSIAVTEYADHNWPVNAFAQQDGEALRKLFGPDSVQAFQSQQRELILRELNQLADRTRGDDKGRPIVVHLSANAVVHDGAVYIIPGDGKAGFPGTWIRLDELLEPLRRAQGHRLLILDLRPVADARLGSLGADLGFTLSDFLQQRQKADDLPFPIFCSCGPDVPPLVSRELRLSWFGYFLERALAGTADGWNADRKKDGRVTAEELFGFARDHTQHATVKAVGSGQKPNKHGPADDFTILPVPATGPSAAPKAEPADEYPDWLAAGWKERDRWRDAGDHRRLQRTYRHLEAVLARAEQRWLGGADLTNARTEFENELPDLTALRAKYPDPVPPAVSLERARAKVKNLDEARAALGPLIERIKSPPPPKKDAGPGKKEEDPELAKLVAAVKMKPPEAEAVPALFFEAVVRDRKEWGVDPLKQLVAIAGDLAGRPKHVEFLTLAFITRLDPKRLSLWEPTTAQRLLLATEAAEQAAAIDGRALPWVRGELQKTDAKRRAAVVKLVTGDIAGREEARRDLDACAKQYGAIRSAAGALHEALTELDETRVFLAAWVEFEAPDLATQRELDALWASITGGYKELLPLVAPPAEPMLPDAEQLKSRANDLQRRRERVLDLLKVPASASSLTVQAWLRSPFWSAEQRSRLALRMRETGLAPVEQALRSPPEKPEGPRSMGAPELPKRPLRRALDVLTLCGDAEVGKKETTLGALAGDDWANLQSFAHAVARAWGERLPERYRQAKDPAERERIGWAVHPFDLPAVPRSGDTFPRDAAAENRARQEKEFARWLAENRYQLDAREFAKLPGAGPETFSRGLEELARELLNWSQ